MNDILLTELEIALQRYERNDKPFLQRNGRVTDFITRFLYLLDHGMNVTDRRLKRIIPWCRRWMASTDITEYTLLERKISFVLDIYIETRKYEL